MRLASPWRRRSSPCDRRARASPTQVRDHDDDQHAGPGDATADRVPVRRAVAGVQPAIHASYRRRAAASAFSAGLSCTAPASAAASDADRRAAALSTRWSRPTSSVVVPSVRQHPRASSRRRSRQPSMRDQLVARREAGALAGAVAQHVRDLDAGERALVDANAEALRERRRLRFDLDGEALQQRRQRQLVGAVHPGRELALERAAADRLERGGDVGFVDRPAAALLPEQAHDVVERAVAFAAQGQVEGERDERALGVVADRRVRRVLVGAVVLDPGVEARLGDALHQRAPATPAPTRSSSRAASGSAARRSGRRAARTGRRSTR